MRQLRHFFLPHPDNGHRAHLLKVPSLLVYIGLVVVLQAGLFTTAHLRPDILGVKSTITVQEIIDQTNGERQKVGAPTLSLNPQLSEAALAKGKDMIAKNYWSHTTPEGKQPWDFITSNGYVYVFAGENLARNFSDSPSVMKAWLASPSHKANLLDAHYHETGVAVLEGYYGGTDTVLIVQMFGTQPNTLAARPTPAATTLATASAALVTPGMMPPSQPIKLEETQPSVMSGTSPAFDTMTVARLSSLGLVSFIAVLFALDWLVISNQKVTREVGHHSAHILFFILIAFIAYFTIHVGSITVEAVKHVALF